MEPKTRRTNNRITMLVTLFHILIIKHARYLYILNVTNVLCIFFKDFPKTHLLVNLFLKDIFNQKYDPATAMH